MLGKQLKTFVKQIYLHQKFASKNIIEGGVVFSKDTIIEGDSYIGGNTVFWPGVKISRHVRIGQYVRLSNITIGANSCVERGVICTGHGKGQIRIGRESYIGHRAILDWSDNITIGNYVHIAGSSTGLWTHTSAKVCLNSIPLSKGYDEKYRPTAPIVIEDNVYIGGNCTIYPGVTIHNHSVVAPNSAVTKDVPSYTMVGGVPAAYIKKVEI